MMSFLFLSSLPLPIQKPDIMDQGKKVWAPDLKEGFILGEICDFGTDVIMIQPVTGGAVSRLWMDATLNYKKMKSRHTFFLLAFQPLLFLFCYFIYSACSYLQIIEAPYDSVFPSEEDSEKDAEDNCTCHTIPTKFGPIFFTNSQ